MADAPGKASGRRKRFTVDELFVDTRPQAVGVSDLTTAKEISLDRIMPDPEQPRRTFDQERLDELAESIRIEGVLQPIVVRYNMDNDQYIVVHGERRLRAATQAGLTAIPAIVREVPAERRLIQQLMENIVRDDLNPIDRSVALRALKQQLGDAPWESVAAAVGIKRSRLFQLLSTEKLPEPIQDDIRAGRMSEKQSRALQNLDPRFQLALRDQMLAHDLPADAALAIARTLRTYDAPEDERRAQELVRMARDSVQAGGHETPPTNPESAGIPAAERARSALSALEQVARGESESVPALAEFLAGQRVSPHAHRRLDQEAVTLAAMLARLHAAPRRDREQARPLLESLRNALNALLDESSR
jgi:ParB family chromosome partitioning protein